MGLHNFDIESTLLAIDGLPIVEYIVGTGIEIELDEDDFIFEQGSHGFVISMPRPNSLATCTLRVMQGSPANDYLQAKRDADVQSRGRLPMSFLCQDLQGTSRVVAARARIMKPPPQSFGTEANAREWPLKLVVNQYKVGSNFLV